MAAVLVFALLLPGEPYLIPLFYLVQELPIGDVAGLVLAESARELPFAILLLWIFISALPSDVVGAAELEAGRGARMIARIIVPLTAPVAVAVGLWVFITSWSEAKLPTILLNNSTLAPAPVALQSFAGTADTQINQLAAGSLLVIAPVLLVLLIAYGPAANGLSMAARRLTA
jgi:ABC-type glycerol-3-phosphate transport system permease component